MRETRGQEGLTASFEGKGQHDIFTYVAAWREHRLGALQPRILGIEAVGVVVHYLVTGVAGAVENPLGMDGVKPLVVSVRDTGVVERIVELGA